MNHSRVTRIAGDMIAATLGTAAIVGAVVVFVWSLYRAAGVTP